MACQTRSGVAGISSLLLPIASVIALITAADAPIDPELERRLDDELARFDA